MSSRGPPGSNGSRRLSANSQFAPPSGLDDDVNSIEIINRTFSLDDAPGGSSGSKIQKKNPTKKSKSLMSSESFSIAQAQLKSEPPSKDQIRTISQRGLASSASGLRSSNAGIRASGTSVPYSTTNSKSSEAIPEPSSKSVPNTRRASQVAGNINTKIPSATNQPRNNSRMIFKGSSCHEPPPQEKPRGKRSRKAKPPPPRNKFEEAQEKSKEAAKRVAKYLKKPLAPQFRKPNCCTVNDFKQPYNPYFKGAMPPQYYYHPEKLKFIAFNNEMLLHELCDPCYQKYLHPLCSKLPQFRYLNGKPIPTDKNSLAYYIANTTARERQDEMDNDPQHPFTMEAEVVTEGEDHHNGPEPQFPKSCFTRCFQAYRDKCDKELKRKKRIGLYPPPPERKFPVFFKPPRRIPKRKCNPIEECIPRPPFTVYLKRPYQCCINGFPPLPEGLDPDWLGPRNVFRAGKIFPRLPPEDTAPVGCYCKPSDECIPQAPFYRIKSRQKTMCGLKPVVLCPIPIPGCNLGGETVPSSNSPKRSKSKISAESASRFSEALSNWNMDAPLDATPEDGEVEDPHQCPCGRDKCICELPSDATEPGTPDIQDTPDPIEAKSSTADAFHALILAHPPGTYQSREIIGLGGGTRSKTSNMSMKKDSEVKQTAFYYTQDIPPPKGVKFNFKQASSFDPIPLYRHQMLTSEEETQDIIQTDYFSPSEQLDIFNNILNQEAKFEINPEDPNQNIQIMPLDLPSIPQSQSQPNYNVRIPERPNSQSISEPKVSKSHSTTPNHKLPRLVKYTSFHGRSLSSIPSGELLTHDQNQMQIQSSNSTLNSYSSISTNTESKEEQS